MATIRIPPVLRPSVGGEREVSADGSNVGEVLHSLVDAHGETQDQIFGADGDLNRYVNVYLNDEDVRVLDGLDTPVGEGDVLVILPAMAGGLTAGGRRAEPRRPGRSPRRSPHRAASAGAIAGRRPALALGRGAVVQRSWSTQPVARGCGRSPTAAQASRPSAIVLRGEVLDEVGLDRGAAQTPA